MAGDPSEKTSIPQCVPRSRRAQFRAKATSVSFRYVDGHLIEEASGVIFPSWTSSVLIGYQSGDAVKLGTLCFDAEGRPGTSEAESYLLNAYNEHLFLVDGRRRPLARECPSTDSPQEWEGFLESRGLGILGGGFPWRTDRFPQPNRRHGGRFEVPPPVNRRQRGRRDLMNLYPSEWKRLVASRLATLFDEQPSNPLIQRMASTLAGENWWTWSGDRELLPLLRRIEAHPPWTAWGLRAIERICFLRRQQAGLRRDRMTLRLGYSKDGIGVQFLFHRDRSGQIRRSDRQAFAIAGSVPVPGRGTIDVRRMAAAAWKARTHLVEPADLVRRRPTLGLVADHFNLKAWRVRYTAQKLLAQLERQLKQ